MSNDRELERIRERYARRTRAYEPWVPWIYQSRHELEREILRTLRDAGMLPPTGRSLVDIGCGTGGNLLYFLRCGFSPGQLAGSELQEERAQMARSLLPSTTRVYAGDASSIDLHPESFDVVFQSLVFSSILDDSMQEALARRMWRLTRPGGGVLWYDFTWNNPSNADVRGVPLRRIRELFPSAHVKSKRVTLAPPISRVVTALHPTLYGPCNVLPLLRTHLLCWLAKNGAS